LADIHMRMLFALIAACVAGQRPSLPTGRPDSNVTDIKPIIDHQLTD